jgi:hypothetical protein
MDIKKMPEVSYELSLGDDGSMNLTIGRDGGRLECTTRHIPVEDYAIVTSDRTTEQPSFRIEGIQRNGSYAIELGMPLDAQNKNSTEEALACREYIVVAWIRVNTHFHTEQIYSATTSERTSETIILCRTRVMVGSAEIVVDAAGQVKERLWDNTTDKNVDSYFSTSATDLIGQANGFVIDSGRVYQNDSYPSDFNNFFIRKEFPEGSAHFLDYLSPPPPADLAARYYAFIYKKLFAVVIGYNAGRLYYGPDDNIPLVDGGSRPSSVQQQLQMPIIEGTTTRPTLRLRLSFAAFIIAESILGLSILTTVLIYVRRPWSMLPRSPDSTASTLGFVAAGRAIRQLAGTANLSTASRDEFLQRLGGTWRYGTFVGEDGETHTGIEKTEYFMEKTEHPLEQPKGEAAVLLRETGGD